MAAPYDLTNASNMSGIPDLFTTSNQLTGGMFGTVILVVLWVMVFMQLKNYSSKAAALAASFITTLVAVMLFLMSMISSQVLVVCVVLTAISFAINWSGD
jgi:predicted cation transporter